MEITIGRTVLVLVEGDITEEETDAVVNAANPHLAGGGGVDGAIHRAGGPKIMEECRRIRGCPAGRAIITSAGDLKVKYVIHAVGPVYRDGLRHEPELLASAYRESLRLASRYGVRSLSFPSIGTGAYGYPIPEAAEIALRTVISYLKDHPEIGLVRFVLYRREFLDIYCNALGRLTGVSRDER
ncbi:MAG: O-acetyl-ADP-ribose deacetylase [Pseudomonadota bacterium]